jgi:hypothetical protein
MAHSSDRWYPFHRLQLQRLNLFDCAYQLLLEFEVILQAVAIDESGIDLLRDYANHLSISANLFAPRGRSKGVPTVASPTRLVSRRSL